MVRTEQLRYRTLALEVAAIQTKPTYVGLKALIFWCEYPRLCSVRDRRDEETNPPNVEACLDVETERFLKLFEQLA